MSKIIISPEILLVKENLAIFVHRKLVVVGSFENMEEYLN